MTDLIARLEAAEAGSRELDGEIAALLGLNPPWAPHHSKTQKELFKDGGPGLRARTWLAPHLTTSLDAITALIGEKLPGYYFGLQENRWPQEPESTTRRWSAYLNAPLGQELEGTHRDKYIACCIVLLRAIKEGADD